MKLFIIIVAANMSCSQTPPGEIPVEPPIEVLAARCVDPGPIPEITLTLDALEDGPLFGTKVVSSRQLERLFAEISMVEAWQQQALSCISAATNPWIDL